MLEASSRQCLQKRRFEVGEGDVFVVPRLHEKAQMAFNEGPLVLMGFSSVSDGHQVFSSLEGREWCGGEDIQCREYDRGSASGSQG